MTFQLKLLTAHIRYGLASGAFFRKRAGYPKQDRDDSAVAGLDIPMAEADEAAHGNDSVHSAKPPAIVGASA